MAASRGGHSLGEFVIGDIVVLPFPFSDLSGSKRRPGFVIGVPDDFHLIIAQITSKSYHDVAVIELKSEDFYKGNLPITSYIRSTKIFTALSETVLYKAGTVGNHIKEKVFNELVKIFDYRQ